MDLKDPKIETKESILSFSKENKVNADIIFISKSLDSFDEVINPFFNMGSIWVFNNRGLVLDVNIENEGGSCFEDIKNNFIKNNFNTFPKLSEKILENNFFEKLFSNIDCIKGCNYELKNYDYIIVYGWSIYYGLSYKNYQIEEIFNYRNKINSKTLIIGINNDFINTWYPKDKALPKVL